MLSCRLRVIPRAIGGTAASQPVIWLGETLGCRCRRMPEDEESRITRYRETARILRRVAEELRFDLRRRNQLLALAAGFDQSAARIEAQLRSDAAN